MRSGGSERQQGFWEIPLGDGDAFLRWVSVPQSFSFVLLIVIASFILQDPQQVTLQYLVSIVYILLFSLVCRRVQEKFNFRTIVVELAGLLALIFGFAISHHSHPTFGVYLPLCFILLSLYLLGMLFRQRVYVILMMLGYALLVFALVYPQTVSVNLEGLLFVLSGSIVLLLQPSREEEELREHFESLAPEVREDATFSSFSTDPDSDQLIDQETYRLLRVAEKVQRKELVSELSGRLAVLALFSAIVVFAVPYLYDTKSKTFGICWLLIALAQVALHHVLLRRTRLRDVLKLGVMTASLNFFWWSLLPLFHLGPQIFYDFLLGVLVLGVGALAWSGPSAVALYLGLLTIMVQRLSLSPHPFGFGAFYFCILVTSIRGSIVHHYRLMTRVGGLVVARTVENASVRAVLCLLAWHMRQIVTSDRVVAVLGNTAYLADEEDSFALMDVDATSLRAFLQLLHDTGSEGGVVDRRLIGGQFVPLWKEFFGKAPVRVYFIRMSAVFDEEEKSVFLFAPVTFWARMGNVDKVFRGLYTVASFAKLSFSASKRRFRSADMFLAAQRSAVEREQEFNQVVHRVNNTAQDISIHCDNVRALIEGHSFNSSDEVFASDMLEQLRRLQVALRNLSAGVSDVKLLKELTNVRNFDRQESVRLSILWEDLEAYADYLTQRSHTQILLENHTSEDIAVEVISREYLQASLRLCLRVAWRRLGEQGRMKVVAKEVDDTVVFEIWDNGILLSERDRATLYSAGQLGNPSDEGDSFRAVLNLMRLSKGELKFISGQGEYSNGTYLTFCAHRMSDASPAYKDGWVLLVDDSYDVTTFYSRIAEALQLEYRTAESVTSAKEIVENTGAPRLVITDIQMADGSGLDLVRYLRDKFGDGLPIIVVSGNTESTVANDVKESGASKFLSKPVGRRQLFAEVEMMLTRPKGLA